MGIIWTSREVFTGDRKSGPQHTPEKPEVAGVATVAGAVTPAPVLQDPLASYPIPSGRLGATQTNSPSFRSPDFEYVAYRVLIVANIVLWAAVWAVVLTFWKLGMI